MNLYLRHGLPFATALIVQNSKSITIDNLLIDTGSAGTLLSADLLATIGIEPEPGDKIHRIRGVGGSEFVFTKTINALTIDTITAHELEVEAGMVDYGFEINGIIGMNFFLTVKAIIDFDACTILSQP